MNKFLYEVVTSLCGRNYATIVIPDFDDLYEKENADKVVALKKKYVHVGLYQYHGMSPNYGPPQFGGTIDEKTLRILEKIAENKIIVERQHLILVLSENGKSYEKTPQHYNDWNLQHLDGLIEWYTEKSDIYSYIDGSILLNQHWIEFFTQVKKIISAEPEKMLDKDLYSALLYWFRLNYGI